MNVQFLEAVVALTSAVGVLGFVIRQLFERLERLEKRQDVVEESLRCEQQKSNRLERILDRACTGYDLLRDRILSIAHDLRSGRTIRDETLRDMETTPTIKSWLATAFTDTDPSK